MMETLEKIIILGASCADQGRGSQIYKALFDSDKKEEGELDDRDKEDIELMNKAPAAISVKEDPMISSTVLKRTNIRKHLKNLEVYDPDEE